MATSLGGPILYRILQTPILPSFCCVQLRLNEISLARNGRDKFEPCLILLHLHIWQGPPHAPVMICQTEVTPWKPQKQSFSMLYLVKCGKPKKKPPLGMVYDWVYHIISICKMCDLLIGKPSHCAESCTLEIGCLPCDCSMPCRSRSVQTCRRGIRLYRLFYPSGDNMSNAHPPNCCTLFHRNLAAVSQFRRGPQNLRCESHLIVLTMLEVFIQIYT